MGEGVGMNSGVGRGTMGAGDGIDSGVGNG